MGEAIRGLRQAWRRRRRARDCIDDDVLETISLFGVDVHAAGSTEKEKADDDDRFIRELRAVYAAPGKDAVTACVRC